MTDSDSHGMPAALLKQGGLAPHFRDAYPVLNNNQEVSEGLKVLNATYNYII